jgi:High potential iron-sulfur protein
MTTRRSLIQSIPALPFMTAAGAAALLAACGDKKSAEAPVVTAPAPAAQPVVAAPEPAAAPAPATAAAPVATGPLVDEKDPQAVALGYVAVAAKADKAKFPKYADGQMCSNCSLYQGGAAAQGGCPLYPGKQVLATAWCSAHNKKAA